MILPPTFEDAVRQQLGAQAGSFLESLGQQPPVSVRLNPRKKNLFEDQPAVPWCNEGRYLPERPVFTLDPLFHAGSYYVQEASSMFLAQALQQRVPLTTPLAVLDLCAAPGGKSTLLQSLLHPDSLLVSNEVIRTRASVLAENIQKWGYPNAIVTNNDPRDFQFLKGFFDVLVIDAPCSGEGLFRKDGQARAEWSPANVQHCAIRQKRILSDAWDALREDGILIYCTCTYNEEENENNLDWLHQHHGVETVKVDVAPGWGVAEVTTPRGMHACRFYPHRVKGEGFFIAVMRKKETVQPLRLKSKRAVAAPGKKFQETVSQWIKPSFDAAFFQFHDRVFLAPSARAAEFDLLLRQLSIQYAGTNLGTVKHDKIIPDHALATSVVISENRFPRLALSEDEAIRYLRKDVLQRPDAPAGMTLVTFMDQPLGWANVLANRINNMYPPEWRIRMDHPGADR